MIKEAVILAGGLGTRLREAVPELPKCLAPVAGKPFLFYVIQHLRLQGIEHFIFSLGHKHEYITRYLEEEFSTLEYTVIIENEPLGTGGAIKYALSYSKTNHVLATNGDTLFKVNLTHLWHTKQSLQSVCTLALKPMTNFDRYGCVTIDSENVITAFNEKGQYSEGLINGGVYVIDKARFGRYNFPEKFSFEKAFLETEIDSRALSGVADNGYFIDIGIPSDFEKAQHDLKTLPLDFSEIDDSWTLFLDRDGVLNEEKKASYVFNVSELRMYDYVPESIRTLSVRFGKTVIVTNQRGVGRGLMTLDDLHKIHGFLLAEIHASGGKIDAVYSETSTDDKNPNRKPNVGMASQAKNQFPQIDFSKSIMVGNSMSDMKFGKNAGMYTVMVQTTDQSVQLPHPYVDFLEEDLAAFAAKFTG